MNFCIYSLQVKYQTKQKNIYIYTYQKQCNVYNKYDIIQLYLYNSQSMYNSCFPSALQ